MKKITLFILSIFITIVSLYAAPASQNQDFISVEKQLTSNSNISGKFIQTRQISGLDNDLKSSGTFQLKGKNSLIWIQQKPIKIELKLSKNKLSQTIMDNPQNILTQEKQPVVFTFTNIFMSMLKGDASSINEYFNMKFKGNTDKWTIVLSPKSTPINKAIKKIILKGGKYITHIEVNDTQNNIIKIQLLNIKKNK
ncbi:hypothetical protein fh0823_20220 [Francisella halioticida]|uniref:Outer membrane lipoprotein carrier protein LolA n=1 Tax=Francisella halioticida TaxID=549298 RepID=A0ABM6M238_9GAMM|nr:outer membrane lipoprotein carrier protein LolA [Francisella halioticida]ASG68893.1 hypothetical protein CDV26_11355 [Francisella halioticida]BCD91883.1 hypothetical protein fh0823_20220 [Francisella halioticida]